MRDYEGMHVFRLIGSEFTGKRKCVTSREVLGTSDKQQKRMNPPPKHTSTTNFIQTAICQL